MFDGAFASASLLITSEGFESDKTRTRLIEQLEQDVLGQDGVSEWPENGLPAISGAQGVIACALHDEIKLRAFASNTREAVNLIDCADPEKLTEMLAAALPGDRVRENASGSHPRPIAALYGDDDKALLARIAISDVGYLHELRDTILALNDEFELQLQKELMGRARRADAPFPGKLRISADRSSRV